MSVNARAILDAAMTENEWQSLVIGYAASRKWKVHHQLIPFRIGRNGKPRAITEDETEPGFVDLVLVRDRIIFAELKTMKGQRSLVQAQWAEWIIKAGGEYHLWVPADYDDVCLTLL